MALRRPTWLPLAVLAVWPALVAAKKEHPASFPLKGAHGGIPCRSCHTRPESAPAGPPAPACAGCHDDGHDGDMGTDCGRCHAYEPKTPGGEASWQDTTPFDHAKGPPLTGAHAGLACKRCHSAKEKPPEPRPCAAASVVVDQPPAEGS